MIKMVRDFRGFFFLQGSELLFRGLLLGFKALPKWWGHDEYVMWFSWQRQLGLRLEHRQ